jgi:phosphatidylserine decarboxylase
MRSLRYRLSLFVGWLADRRIPGFLRAPIYRSYARFTGADLTEIQLPLTGYPSLGAFFVRRLASGARPVDETPGCLVSPCDGKVTALERVSADGRLVVKGQAYTVAELLAGAELGPENGPGNEVDLVGGWSWTIYLGPRDYHRVHAPAAARLTDVRWVPGDRRSVADAVVARHERVLATNERAVLRMEAEGTPYFLVMVGALNVGRIRVQGVEPGSSPADHPSPAGAPEFDHGAELARVEMGSTVVLVFPPGAVEPLPEVGQDASVRLGRPLGTLTSTASSSPTSTEWRSAKPTAS